MPWQFGALGLTEQGGNRIIKYADALNHGVSIAVWDIVDSTLTLL